ncbi:hypothetical protein KC614_03805 [candidate division WWE3 bacterium]|uniref:Uncharacterized protein n=1 Tax=candidate division WWE3 bacterium TaxID=2053526 RepID=A0A955LLX7_UNCKA|nr:hypothetical protein [candidate division WWE3 bacterium]
MEESAKKINYKGKEYNSIEEMPEEVRKVLTPEFMSGLMENNAEVVMQSLSNDKGGSIMKLPKYIFAIVAYVFSIAEGQAFRTLGLLLNVSINPLVSFIASMIIGQISYMLAVKKVESMDDKLKISYGSGLGFLTKFGQWAVAGQYVTLINLAFYAFVFAVKYFV